jgi:membrane protein
MRASNSIYDVPEGRPIWKTAPVRLGVTIVTMVLLVAAAAIVIVTGGGRHHHLPDLDVDL